MNLSWFSKMEEKREKVKEAARKGRLDDINSCLEGLHRCDIVNVLCGDALTKTTPLAGAIEEGQTEAVRLLVEKYKVNVNGRNPSRKAPLLMTGEACPLEITKILVENGADVNHFGKHNATTALTRACEFNRLDVVQYLVGKGAVVNQVIDEGTALHLACRNGCLDIVRYLVEHGADVNLAVGSSQETPLHGACQTNSLDVAKYLVEHGANVNATDRVGCSPFGNCCKNGSTDVMRFLLKNGADPNLPDHCGRTPLVHAAMNQKKSAVACCIDLPNISRQAKVDGLELLGASLILEGQAELGHMYLSRAMEERRRDPLHAVEKGPLPPVPAYGDFRESQTLEELEQKRWESTLLTKEALLIWERVLGRGTKEVKRTFSRVVDENTQVPITWLQHALRTSRSDLTMTDAEALISVTLKRKPLAFSILEETLKLSFQAMSNHEDNNRKGGFNSYLSLVYTQGIIVFQKALSVAQTKEEMQRLEDLLKNFLQLTIPGINGSSALHIALDGNLQNAAFCDMENVKLSPDYISLLLGCKADLVHAKDDDGNTPLHLLFSRSPRNYISLLFGCKGDLVHANDDDGNTPLHLFYRPHHYAEMHVPQRVAEILLQAGAHLDSRNRKSQTPLQCLYAGHFWRILMNYTCILPSLQCMCARVILDEKVPFHSRVPERLKKFIELH